MTQARHRPCRNGGGRNAAVAALLVLTAVEARAVINPSAAAPLTGTSEFVEWVPHLAADGSALAFAGSADPSNLRWERFVLDLSADCHDSPLLRLTDDDEPTGGGGGWTDAQVSLSADGALLAHAVHAGTSAGFTDDFDVRLIDRVADTATTLATVLVKNTAGPRPTLSADGAYVLVQEAYEVGFGSFQWRARRFATDQATCTWDCDCTVAFNANQPVVSATQAALSADGRYVVGSDSNFPATAIRRIEFLGGSCGSLASVTLADNDAPGVDVTISGDGTVAAWSTYADYETGGSFGDTNVWVWQQTPSTTGCPGAQCVASPAGGRLVRVNTSPVERAEDTKPLVTADGRRVFFLSPGDYDGQNPFGAQALWVVDLENTSSWAPQRVSPLETAPLATILEHATASADGTAAAYQLFHDTDGDGLADARDLRLVLVDDDTAADLLEPPGLTAAHQPYEVEGVSCSHLGGGAISVRYAIRQFRGGTRQLVTTLEALAAGGTARRLGPLVQQLRDEHVAEVARTITLADGDLDDVTCRALVLWGAGAQPDAVTASWQ